MTSYECSSVPGWSESVHQLYDIENIESIGGGVIQPVTAEYYINYDIQWLVASDALFLNQIGIM